MENIRTITINTLGLGSANIDPYAKILNVKNYTSCILDGISSTGPLALSLDNTESTSIFDVVTGTKSTKIDVKNINFKATTLKGLT